MTKRTGWSTKDPMTYKIGQVVFVAPTKGGARLVPIQIVEVVTKRSLVADAEVKYLARLGSEGKVVDIKSIDGEVFDSVATAKQVLIERATNSISKIIEHAATLAENWFEKPAKVVSQPKPEKPVIQPQQNEDATVVLEDGTRARIKLPEELKEDVA